MDAPVNQMGHGRGKHPQTDSLDHESKNGEIHKNCLQTNLNHKYFILKLVVLAGVKHAGTLQPQRRMSEMEEAKMQLARCSAEGVTANTETEGSMSDKN